MPRPSAHHPLTVFDILCSTMLEVVVGNLVDKPSSASREQQQPPSREHATGVNSSVSRGAISTASPRPLTSRGKLTASISFSGLAAVPASHTVSSQRRNHCLSSGGSSRGGGEVPTAAASDPFAHESVSAGLL